MSGLPGLSNQARLRRVLGVLPSYLMSWDMDIPNFLEKSAGKQAHAAIDPQHLAVDEAGLVAGQEGDGIGDFRRLGVALQRYPFHQGRIGGAGGEKARGGGGAGAD